MIWPVTRRAVRVALAGLARVGLPAEQGASRSVPSPKSTGSDRGGSSPAPSSIVRQVGALRRTSARRPGPQVGEVGVAELGEGVVADAQHPLGEALRSLATVKSQAR